MRRTVLVLTALVSAGLIALGSVAFAADASFGTWKLNVAKSTWSPGPASKSQIAKVEAWGEDGVKYSSDLVGADGKATRMEFQAKFDGKDFRSPAIRMPTSSRSSASMRTPSRASRS